MSTTGKSSSKPRTMRNSSIPSQLGIEISESTTSKGCACNKGKRLRTIETDRNLVTGVRKHASQHLRDDPFVVDHEHLPGHAPFHGSGHRFHHAESNEGNTVYCDRTDSLSNTTIARAETRRKRAELSMANASLRTRVFTRTVALAYLTLPLRRT